MAHADPHLSRRERQIMDVIYARGQASANAVLAGLPDPPGRNAVRGLLRVLEEKGHLTHRVEGRENIYAPTRPRRRAGRSALQRVIDTFFDGSLEQAVAAHLSGPKQQLDPQDLDRLQQLIDQARQTGKEQS